VVRHEQTASSASSHSAELKLERRWEHGNGLPQKSLGPGLGRAHSSGRSVQFARQSLLRWAMDHMACPAVNVVIEAAGVTGKVLGFWPAFPRPELHVRRCWSWPTLVDPCLIDSGPSPLPPCTGQLLASPSPGLFEPSTRTRSKVFELAARRLSRVRASPPGSSSSPRARALLDNGPHLTWRWEA